jgi:hypothetical protein
MLLGWARQGTPAACASLWRACRLTTTSPAPGQQGILKVTSLHLHMHVCGHAIDLQCELVQGLPCLHSGAEAVMPDLKASGSAGSLVGNAGAVRDSGKLEGRASAWYSWVCEQVPCDALPARRRERGRWGGGGDRAAACADHNCAAGGGPSGPSILPLHFLPCCQYPPSKPDHNPRQRSASHVELHAF